MPGVTPAPTVGARRGIPTIGPVTAWILAHAAGGLAGDGVPGALLYGIVVVGSLIGAVGLRARGAAPLAGPVVAPLTVDGAEGGPWPGDAMGPVGRGVGRAVGVGGLALLLVVAWGGSSVFGLNPLPTTLLVLWWSIPVLSLLLGDWWRVIDPYDALAAGIERIRPRPPTTPDDEADEAGDWWVPAVLLATFAWTVTCWLEGFQPRVLGTWLTGLTVVMVAGALLGGRSWVRRSSPMAVLAGTAAAASPLDWAGGRPRLRSPLAGLAARAGGRRSAGVVLVLLGTAFWEAVGGTQWWADVIGPSGVGGGTGSLLWATGGWLGCIVLATCAWIGIGGLAEAVASRAGGPTTEEPFGADAVAALAPVAVAALAAHQLGQLLVYGQYAAAFWSDPFAEGWDLFGTVEHRVDEEVLSPGVLAWSQLALVVVGLALLLAGAWDRLAARVGPAVVSAGWVVAGATAGLGSLALWLLLGA